MDSMIYKCPVTGYWFDPLAIQRRLLVGSKGNINTWIKEQRGEDELIALEAEERMLPVIRAAFGLVEVDKASGSGHPTELVLNTLTHYLQWAEAKKVKGQTSQLESPCVDCPKI